MYSTERGNHVCPSLILVAETAVTRTVVSPLLTTTAPSANRANLPVSMVIGVEPTWLVTLCVLIFCFFFLRSVGSPLLYWDRESGVSAVRPNEKCEDEAAGDLSVNTKSGREFPRTAFSLPSQAKCRDCLLVALSRVAFEKIKQLASAGHQREQSTPGREVLLVDEHVVGQMEDSRGEKSRLVVCTSCILVVELEVLRFDCFFTHIAFARFRPAELPVCPLCGEAGRKSGFGGNSTLFWASLPISTADFPGNQSPQAPEQARGPHFTAPAAPSPLGRSPCRRS